MEVLQALPGACLARLATVSRALYLLTSHNELWKGLVLEASHAYHPLPKPLNPAGFHSEYLYRSWLCGHVAIDSAWLETENVPRRANLTPRQFREEFEIPNRPVILTDVATHWPAMRKWTRGYLGEAFSGHTVLVGDAPMTFDAYCSYADSQCDELPLYLFDKHFAEACPSLSADYSVPEVFSQDLFSVMGSRRPDHRWLIAGPPRSGSTFHQDPNATCAWNGVVRGAKKWVLYPPGATPPGVRPSADGTDVASPVSLTEWFLSFYDLRAASGRAPAECVVREGEVLFVPRQWWHLAMNLEESVAVTQNYVSAANLCQVLAFLSSRNPALVSGLEGDDARGALHDDFLAALQREAPQALAEAEELQAAAQERSRAANKLSALFKEDMEGPDLAGPVPAPAFRFGFS